MSYMERIEGKVHAERIYEKIKQRVQELPFVPVFCDVVVGDDLASLQYVKMKEKRARDIGMNVHQAHFPSSITTKELQIEIAKINDIPYMSGLIVQLPLPSHIDTQAVLNSIDPRHDVDVLHKETSSNFYENKESFIFPTARAIMHILDALPVVYDTKNFVVVGQGRLVGGPVTHLLQKRGYRVATLTQENDNVQEVLQSADVIISATGNDGIIHKDMISPEVILIDAGTSESHGGIKGDVDTLSVGEMPSYIAPVPGGVGPVTVAMLLDNVLQAARNKYI